MDKLFSTKEAAEFLHMSLRKFKYLTSAKKIAPVQIGLRGAKFYSPVQLTEFILKPCTGDVGRDPCKSCHGDTGDPCKRSFEEMDIITSDTFEQLPEEQFDEVYLHLIETDINDAQAHIAELPEDERRGLSLETLRHFRCGYLPNWILTKSRAEYSCGTYRKDNGDVKKLPPPSPRIIIPTASGHHFNAVATKSARRTMSKEFWKQHAGAKELFADPDAFKADILFVVEGEIDAMSIWQASAGKISALAILGCGNWKKTLLPRLHDLQGKKLILLLDADAAGNKAAKKLFDELLHRGCLVVNHKLFDSLTKADQNYFGYKVDANNILKDRGNEFLHNLLQKIITDAQRDFYELTERLNAPNPFAEGADPVLPTPQENSRLVPAQTNSAVVVAAQDTPQTNDYTNREDILRILSYVPAKELSRDEWFSVGCVLKRYGLSLDDFQSWSKDDSRYSAETCRTQWDSMATADQLGGNGYKIGTLIDLAKKFGYQPPKPKNITSEITARINAGKDKLQEIAKALADFDAERDSAIEFLKNVGTFDSDSIFSDEILTAAAFAKLFNRQVFSDFKRDVKKYGDKHKDQKASVNDWLADVKDKVEALSRRRKEMVAEQNRTQAEITSLNFVIDADLQNCAFPAEYSVDENGIFKAAGEFMILVCRRPVIIKSKTFNVEDKIFKPVLAYFTADKWHTLPPTEAAIIFNARKLVDLANAGLSVTSQNANLLVDYLDAFHAENENTFPLSYIVPRCGWYRFNGTNFFVDPRRNCAVTKDERKISVLVEDNSQFAKSLRTVGSMDTWRKAYALIQTSYVARLIVAAAIAPPLLKILGERNFLLYICAPTRAGKTTALYLAASSVGDEKIIRSFDATKNGLAGAAADVNDFPFLIDEKQVADSRLKEQFDTLVYSLANGVGRTKLNKDSTLKKTHDWRTIAVMTGETQLLPDNTTGGAFTRLLTVKSSNLIIPADNCKTIREVIKSNFGHAFPLVVDKIFELGKEKIQHWYQIFLNAFTTCYPQLLNEHCRYLAVLALADVLLNLVTWPNANYVDCIEDGERVIKAIVPLIPTTAELSDTQREIDFVRGWIAQNQNRFIGGSIPLERMQTVYGKLDEREYIFIATKALQDACKTDGFDYHKLVDDLVAANFFVPADSVEKNRKKPLVTIPKRLGKILERCYRIKKSVFDSENS